MTKRIIATALAASLALTSLSTTPARADAGEIARFAVGAGVLLLLGNAIAQNNRNSNRAPVTRRYEDPAPHVVHRDADRPRYEKRRKFVPSSCLRENRWDNGPRRFFGQRCLSNNMRNFDRLPNQCRTVIWTDRGRRSVFAARCLRKNGWKFS